MKQVILLVISLIVNPAFGEFLPTATIITNGVRYSSPQEEYPFYKDGVLTVPRVDAEGQQGTGIFQNAKFTLSEQGIWQLVDFKVGGVDTPQPYIGKVEVIITDSFPTQVFLKVIGGFTGTSNPSAVLGKVSQRLIGNNFEIAIYQMPHEYTFPFKESDLIITNTPSIMSDADSAGLGHGDGDVAFVTIIPLSVYNLRSGTYQYNLVGGLSVNPNYKPYSNDIALIPTTFTGTFELKKDNRF